MNCRQDHKHDWRRYGDQPRPHRHVQFLTAPSSPPQLPPYSHSRYDARHPTEPPHQSLRMPTMYFPDRQGRASNGLNPRSFDYVATEDLLLYPQSRYDARHPAEPPHQSLLMPTMYFPYPQVRASNGLNPRSFDYVATEDLPLNAAPPRSTQASPAMAAVPVATEDLPLTAAPPGSTQASPAMEAAPFTLIGPGWRALKERSNLWFNSPDGRLFKRPGAALKHEAGRRAKATADIINAPNAHNVDPPTAPPNVSPTNSGEEEVDEAAKAPTEQVPEADRPVWYSAMVAEAAKLAALQVVAAGAAGAAAIRPQVLAAAQESVEGAEGALDDEVEVAEQAEVVEEEANGALDNEVVAEQAEVVEEANDALDDEVMVEQADAGAAGAAAIPEVLAAAQEPVEDAEGALDDEAEQAEVVEEAELVPAPALPPPLEVEAGGAFNAEVNNNQNEALAMAEVEGEMEHCNL